MSRSRTSRSQPHARNRGSNADLADKHDLYQRAVQNVVAEIDFVDRTFTKLRGRKAAWLREDFCGTANTSCEWVRRRRTNHAVGLDLHAPTLEWGIRHNLSKLTDAQRTRLELRMEDVLRARAGAEGGFDIVLAMNFSYWCFKQRSVLLQYFTAVRRSLKRDGVFFLDIFGGSDSMREIQEPRKIPARPGGGYGSPAFTYVWDHARYRPISGEIMCHIHFRFADGSEKKRAFTYDWRLWSAPEVCDALTDAGFSRSTVYWEGTDKNGQGNGVFRPSARGQACESFIAYIAAEP
ncbi:MAG: class I SAM-dependent methyltransferase [Phycisphaerales bacterium]